MYVQMDGALCEEVATGLHEVALLGSAALTVHSTPQKNPFSDVSHCPGRPADPGLQPRQPLPCARHVAAAHGAALPAAHRTGGGGGGGVPARARDHARGAQGAASGLIPLLNTCSVRQSHRHNQRIGVDSHGVPAPYSYCRACDQHVWASCPRGSQSSRHLLPHAHIACCQFRLPTCC